VCTRPTIHLHDLPNLEGAEDIGLLRSRRTDDRALLDLAKPAQWFRQRLVAATMAGVSTWKSVTRPESSHSPTDSAFRSASSCAVSWCGATQHTATQRALWLRQGPAIAISQGRLAGKAVDLVVAPVGHAGRRALPHL
jgi:hypothetical protein